VFGVKKCRTFREEVFAKLLNLAEVLFWREEISSLKVF